MEILGVVRFERVYHNWKIISKSWVCSIWMSSMDLCGVCLWYQFYATAAAVCFNRRSSLGPLSPGESMEMTSVQEGQSSQSLLQSSSFPNQLRKRRRIYLIRALICGLIGFLALGLSHVWAPECPDQTPRQNLGEVLKFVFSYAFLPSLLFCCLPKLVMKEGRNVDMLLFLLPNYHNDT